MTEVNFRQLPPGREQAALQNAAQVGHAGRFAMWLWEDYKKRFQPKEAAMAVFREVGAQLAGQIQALIEGKASLEKIAALCIAWQEQVKIAESEMSPGVIEGK